jgi:hypothetical protein
MKALRVTCFTQNDGLHTYHQFTVMLLIQCRPQPNTAMQAPSQQPEELTRHLLRIFRHYNLSGIHASHALKCCDSG